MATEPKNLGAVDFAYSRRRFIIVTKNSQASRIAPIAGAPVLPIGTPLTYVPGSEHYVPWIDAAQLDSIVTYGDTVDTVTGEVGVQAHATNHVLSPVIRVGELEVDPADASRTAVILPAGQTQPALITALKDLNARQADILVRGLSFGA